MQEGHSTVRWQCPLVGKAGFEPAASTSRTWRAAKLRYFPKELAPQRIPTLARGGVGRGPIIQVGVARLLAIHVLPAVQKSIDGLTDPERIEGFDHETFRF